MKTIGIIFLFVILMSIGACTSEPSVTTATNENTVTSSSTVVSSQSNSTRSILEILAAANAEVASVRIANQAYAAEHDGKYASSSSRLTEYLKGTPDATYYFNTDSGAVTKVVNGSGITRTFYWDTAAQMWQR